jgi:hypothetical protein
MLKQILYCSMTTVLCRFVKSRFPQVIAYIYKTFSIPSLYQIPERHSMQHYIKKYCSFTYPNWPIEWILKYYLSNLILICIVAFDALWLAATSICFCCHIILLSFLWYLMSGSNQHNLAAKFSWQHLLLSFISNFSLEYAISKEHEINQFIHFHKSLPKSLVGWK